MQRLLELEADPRLQKFLAPAAAASTAAVPKPTADLDDFFGGGAPAQAPAAAAVALSAAVAAPAPPRSDALDAFGAGDTDSHVSAPTASESSGGLGAW